jgi:hypothetical protein
MHPVEAETALARQRGDAGTGDLLVIPSVTEPAAADSVDPANIDKISQATKNAQAARDARTRG